MEAEEAEEVAADGWGEAGRRAEAAEAAGALHADAGTGLQADASEGGDTGGRSGGGGRGAEGRLRAAANRVAACRRRVEREGEGGDEAWKALTEAKRRSVREAEGAAEEERRRATAAFERDDGNKGMGEFMGRTHELEKDARWGAGGAGGGGGGGRGAGGGARAARNGRSTGAGGGEGRAGDGEEGAGARR